MDLAPTHPSEPGRRTDGPGNELTRLLLALWRDRVFILVVTTVCILGFVAYSFVQRPVFAARVTMLPRQDNSTAALLGPVASMLDESFDLGDNYEQIYAEIVTSDRILDRAIAARWRHAAFAEPADLYQIFAVDPAGTAGDIGRAHELKTILRSRVISFSRQKTGLMVLTVTAPRDGAFAADLANFLVDELDSFNARVRTDKAEERYEFIAGRVAETGQDLATAEQALADFEAKNRAYATSPELMQEYGVLKREALALTSIWVELRKQLELAEIERENNDESVDVLDRASAPAVSANPRRTLFAAVGLCGGFLVALVLLVLKRQIGEVRRFLASSPAE